MSLWLSLSVRFIRKRETTKRQGRASFSGGVEETCRHATIFPSGDPRQAKGVDLRVSCETGLCLVRLFWLQTVEVISAYLQR